ncbi:MAG: cytochrome P450 [Parvibaculaceae bacterium]
MNMMAQGDMPFLNLSDPSFSIRSAAVREARERSWCARTPYGLAVLRYDEVSKLLRDPRLRQGSYAWPAHNQATGSFANWWLAMLLNRIGDDHARLRRLANPAFSPKLIGALKPKFEGLAHELIDGFARRGRCDFMAEFSEPYATRVICILLGLDQSEWRALAEISAEMGLALGVTYKQDMARVNAATDRLYAYARRVISERRKRPPGDDFVSLLLQANENKDTLSDEELDNMVVLAVFGGIDTTRNQLGLAMSMFIDNPAQWQLLAKEPELARPAVEEVMRTRPTTTWVTRETMEDIVFNGIEIKKGTTLHLFAESAGTDPQVFTPGFDIAAKRMPHFGFGGGVHHCLGHFIARGDMTEALRILAQRVRNPRYDGEPAWLPDSGNTGAVRLPIAFDPEGQGSGQ